MRLRRLSALVGAATATVFAACEHPPFAPKWDADMYLPLSTQPIHLNTFFGTGSIPAGGSGSVNFPAQTQEISGVLGQLLDKMVTDPTRCSSAGGLSCHHVTLTITKTTPVAFQDTLFVASSLANLVASGAGTVVFPLTIAATPGTVVDTLYLTQASVAMLEAAGQNSTPLWIQARGRVSNPGASAVPITGADSLSISLAVTLRVAVSK